MVRKISEIIAITLWIAGPLVLLLSLLTPLEIANNLVLNICLILSISGLLLIINSLFFSKQLKTIIPAIILISICITGLLKYRIKWEADWKTQTIIFENGQFNNKTIEFQILEKGAPKQNKRIVEVTRFTSFLRIVDPVDTTRIGLPWLLVNKNINESGLKP